MTAPILIERNFKHTALSAHWFVLFSIYYYLEYRSKGRETKLPWQMILLAVLNIGIHPYFLPIVMIFVLLIVIQALVNRYSILKIAGYTILSVGLPYGAGVLIGALGTGMKNDRSGYGYFGMNLNTLFNPNSASGYTWSWVLQKREQIYSTYEGFNYIGLGMLIMMAVCFGVFVVQIIGDRECLKKCGNVLKQNLPLVICMLFMTLFAVTNNITWDGQNLFSIPLPAKLVETASIFRSSGRMFWPVYYLIMLSIIYFFLSIPAEKFMTAAFAILLFVQVYDMRDMFQIRNARMAELSEYDTVLNDETLEQIADKEVMVMIGTENFELQRVLAVWAAERGMGVAYSVANTGEYKNAEMYTTYFEEAMWEGIMRDDVVYVTMDADVIRLWRETLEDDIYNEYLRSYYYFVYKD